MSSDYPSCEVVWLAAVASWRHPLRHVCRHRSRRRGDPAAYEAAAGTTLAALELRRRFRRIIIDDATALEHVRPTSPLRMDAGGSPDRVSGTHPVAGDTLGEGISVVPAIVS